jgi:hypothetical protein
MMSCVKTHSFTVGVCVACERDAWRQRAVEAERLLASIRIELGDGRIADRIADFMRPPPVSPFRRVESEGSNVRQNCGLSAL